MHQKFGLQQTFAHTHIEAERNPLANAHEKMYIYI